MSAKRYLKKASRLSPLRWNILRIFSSWSLSITDCASSNVALSSPCTSIKNLWRWARVMIPFSEYCSNRDLISAGASEAARLNRRRKQKHTLYVCFDDIISGVEIENLGGKLEDINFGNVFEMMILSCVNFTSVHGILPFSHMITCYLKATLKRLKFWSEVKNRFLS